MKNYAISFLGLLVFLLLFAGCEKNDESDDLSPANKPANVLLEGNPSEVVIFSNGYPNQLVVSGKVKNQGEGKASNVTVKYTNGSISKTVSTAPEILEPGGIASFNMILSINMLPSGNGNCKVYWD